MANELVLEDGVWKFREATTTSGGETPMTSSLDSFPTGSVHPTSSLSEYNTSLTTLTQVT